MELNERRERDKNTEREERHMQEWAQLVALPEPAALLERGQ